MKKITLTVLLLCGFGLSILMGQSANIRGNVYDKASGDPIIYGTVVLEGTDLGTNTDIDGFFSIGNVEPGKYTLAITYVGYDRLELEVAVKEGAIIYKQFYMEESAIELGTVSVSARKTKAKSEVQVSQVTLTPKQIRSLPATGGEADIAQYLPVLPGIISTGDQGGQLYIRGGSPIQNLILLDGMTIYNPFHSIGFSRSLKRKRSAQSTSTPAVLMPTTVAGSRQSSTSKPAKEIKSAMAAGSQPALSWRKRWWKAQSKSLKTTVAAAVRSC